MRTGPVPVFSAFAQQASTLKPWRNSRREKDTEVLAHARQREQVLLTFDRDFGELLYRRAEPAPTGVVFFRFIPAGPDEAAEVLLGLRELQSIQLIDRYTVVARERVRQRPLLRAD